LAAIQWLTWFKQVSSRVTAAVVSLRRKEVWGLAVTCDMHGKIGSCIMRMGVTMVIMSHVMELCVSVDLLLVTQSPSNFLRSLL